MFTAVGPTQLPPGEMSRSNKVGESLGQAGECLGQAGEWGEGGGDMGMHVHI